MLYEITIHEFKKIFFERYGIDFIDGFSLFQSPINVIEYGAFELYDDYADEDVYNEIPILRNLFQNDEEVYIYTDQAYYDCNIFVVQSNEIKNFIKTSPLDFFSNEPLFINFYTDDAFGYSLEGFKLNSGIFYQLNLNYLRETNKKLKGCK